MKSGSLLLSVYPLSSEYLTSIKEKLGQGFEQRTLAELRQQGGFQLFFALRKIRPDTLLLPLEDENSAALLPILKLLAGFTAAKNIKLVHPDLSITLVPRVNIAADMIKFGFASVGCLWSAIKSWLELRHILRASRIVIPGKISKGCVFYLKTNLWFGIKAGGSVGHIAGVVNALHGQGFPVTFASAEPPVMVEAGVTIQDIAPPKTFGLPYELNNYRFQSGFAYEAKKTLTQPGFSLIYQRLSAANYLGVILSRTFKLPLVVEYNGSEVWIAKNWGRAMRFHTLAAMAEDAMLRHAHTIVTISEVLRDELIEKGVEPTRIVCYPNCIDPKVFSPERFSQEACTGLRQRYGIPVNATLAAFIGTFGQWHGAEVLAEAIAQLYTQDADWLAHHKLHFLLVGDGLKMPLVRSIIESSGASKVCTLAGLVAQNQAPLHLAAADILVSPHVPNPDGTRFFGSPTKLFEYMAMGKGIIASDLDQIGEVLSPAVRTEALPEDPPSMADPSLAVLAIPGDRDDLIKGIKFLVEHPEWRAHVGRNARHQALSKYTWDHHVQAILKGMNQATK